MANHPIRPLVARISQVEDVRPSIVLLEELLPTSGQVSQRPTEVSPLFRPPQVDFDPNHPEFAAELDKARTAAIAELQQSNSHELGILADRYTASLQRLEQAILGIERVMASEVVDLALVVAREFVSAEMRHQPECIVELVEQALAAVPHDGKVSVRMHPGDLQAVADRIGDSADLAIEWVADESLAHGDCIVETPERLIDASIDARLAAVRDSLIRALMAEEAQDEDTGEQ